MLEIEKRLERKTKIIGIFLFYQAIIFFKFGKNTVSLKIL